jgi:hypothetical protein
MTTDLVNRTPLTEPHKQLIRILAQVAIDNYLVEIESSDAVQSHDDLHEDQP